VNKKGQGIDKSVYRIHGKGLPGYTCVSWEDQEICGKVICKTYKHRPWIPVHSSEVVLDNKKKKKKCSKGW
jgi:hypothetical protein